MKMSFHLFRTSFSSAHTHDMNMEKEFLFADYVVSYKLTVWRTSVEFRLGFSIHLITNKFAFHMKTFLLSVFSCPAGVDAKLMKQKSQNRS